MKNVLKIGVLAAMLGLFATACNSGTKNANNSDSTQMSAPATSTPDTTMPADTSGNDTGMSADTSHM